MSLIIRRGETKDLPALLELIKELATFEKEPEAVSNTVEQMTKEQKYFDFFVAEKDEQIVGAAIYFFAYFTWVGKSLYLDDLYVKPGHRGQKIGSQLIKNIFELAKKENCKRLRWQVSNWNAKALEFYKKLGAQINDDCLNCDFNKEYIDKVTQK